MIGGCGGQWERGGDGAGERGEASLSDSGSSQWEKGAVSGGGENAERQRECPMREGDGEKKKQQMRPQTRDVTLLSKK